MYSDTARYVLLSVRRIGLCWEATRAPSQGLEASGGDGSAAPRLPCTSGSSGPTCFQHQCDKSQGVWGTGPPAPPSFNHASENSSTLLHLCLRYVRHQISCTGSVWLRCPRWLGGLLAVDLAHGVVEVQPEHAHEEVDSVTGRVALWPRPTGVLYDLT